jgi:hypothetical protein
VSGGAGKKEGGADGARSHKGRQRASTGGRRDDLPRRLGDIITPALDKLAGGDEARAYAAWARAVGDPVAGGTRPRAFRRGQLTIECASSVWANELTYLGPQILRRMDEVAAGHPVKRFRFIVGRLPASQDADLDASEPAAEESGGQESGPAGAKMKRRRKQPVLDEPGAARVQAEGVEDESLRAAIEAALRRSSQEPPVAPDGSTPSG